MLRSAQIDQPDSGRYRIACNEPCEVLALDGYRERGAIWNLSVAGVYSVLPPPLPPVGRKLLLTFSMVGDGMPVTCEARVQWHNPPSIFKGCGSVKAGLPPGCGLAFVKLEPADAARIVERVSACRSHRASLAGDPEPPGARGPGRRHPGAGKPPGLRRGGGP